MNKDIKEGGWKVLQGRMRAQWGKLTEQDMEEARGNLQALTGKLQVYYGKAKQNIQAEIAEFRSGLKKDRVAEEGYFDATDDSETEH